MILTAGKIDTYHVCSSGVLDDHVPHYSLAELSMIFHIALCAFVPCWRVLVMILTLIFPMVVDPSFSVFRSRSTTFLFKQDLCYGIINSNKTSFIGHLIRLFSPIPFLKRFSSKHINTSRSEMNPTHSRQLARP